MQLFSDDEIKWLIFCARKGSVEDSQELLNIEREYRTLGIPLPAPLESHIKLIADHVSKMKDFRKPFLFTRIQGTDKGSFKRDREVSLRFRELKKQGKAGKEMEIIFRAEFGIGYERAREIERNQRNLEEEFKKNPPQ